MFRLLFTPFRWLFKLIVILLVVGIVALWAILYFADDLLEREIRKTTGFPTHVGTLDVRVLATRLDLLDMEVRNPTHFAEDDFLKIDRFSARLRPFSLVHGTKEWRDVVLYIDSLALVQNVDGEVNADQFLRKIGGGHSPFLPATSGEGVPQKPFVIRNLEIRIGSLKTVNEGRDEQVSRTTSLRYSRKFENVQSLQILLQEMERDMDPVAAQLVIYLLAETLAGMDRWTGGSQPQQQEWTDSGYYLWELGEAITFRLKNFIEGRKE